MAKRSDRNLKILSYHRDNKQVPELQLIGVWRKAAPMEQLGFNIGKRVNITTRERLLIIEPAEEVKEETDYKAALQEVRQTLKKLV